MSKQTSEKASSWPVVILCLVVVISPFLFFLWLWEDVTSALFPGIFIGGLLISVFGKALPDPDPNKQRDKEIKELKESIKWSEDSIRKAMAELIDLEDHVDNGQVHLRKDIRKKKEEIERYKEYTVLFQDRLAQLEEEDRRWRELKQRADERYEQTMKSIEKPS